MKKKYSEPILRFPEFQNNKGDKFFKKYEFDDIFKFSVGKNIKKNEASENIMIPCIHYTELYHKYSEVIREVNSKTNISRENSILSKGNEILIPAKATDPLQIKASALMINGIAIGSTINILSPKFDSLYSSIFVTYYINQKLKGKITSLAKSKSVNTINKLDLQNLEISIPTLKEQERIADFLMKIDKQINLLKDKKACLEEYKKNILKKIFSQEIRFKDKEGNNFPDWTEKYLGEISTKAQSGGTPKSTVKDYYNGNIPFLTISDMTKQGKYLTYTSKSISQKGLENSNAWIVPSHSIIYSMYASVGFVSINKIPVATSQAVMNIILKQGYNLEFIYYSLLNFRKNIQKYTETTTQRNLNAQIVRYLPILIPVISEQEKIGSFLSSLDNSRMKLEKKIQKNIEFKNGILQQIFV